MSVGAILTSVSTVVVALNAQLLRHLDLRPSVSAREILGTKTTIPTQQQENAHAR